MKAATIVMVAVASGLLLSSCSSPPEIILYNNAGRKIVVLSESKTYTLKPGTKEVIIFPGNTEMFVVILDSTRLEYHIAYPPREYCEPVANSKIKAQIEKDGRIYVFLPSVKLPVDKLLPQPEGFPWTPEQSAAREKD